MGRSIGRIMQLSRSILDAARLCLLLGLGWIPACTPPEPPIRVGLTTWPGYDGIRLAGKLGYLGDQPVRIITLTSSTETLRALRDGVIDVAGLTGGQELLAAQQFPEHPPRAVLVLDISSGGDMVLAHPPLARMQDLKGKRVGIEATALGGLMLARALEVSGMRVSDITAVMIPQFDHERAYRDHEVDAIVTSEPRASRILATGAIRLFDSSQIPGEIVDLLVVREETLARSAPAIHAVVAGWFQAQAYARAHRVEEDRQGAERQQAAPAEHAASLAGFQIPDLAANRRMLSAGPGNLTGTLRKLSAIMLRQGLLKREPDPEPLLQDAFLPDNAP
jgi:NitT/TauT family transport system substrate-binding protein